jgi:hypothetical protein
MEAAMAVALLLKSGGLTALAFGLSVTGTASAQEITEQMIADAPAMAPPEPATFTAPEPAAATQSYSTPETIAAPPAASAPSQFTYTARTMQESVEPAVMRPEGSATAPIAEGVVLAQAEGRRGGWGGGFGGGQRGGGESRGGESRGGWSGNQAATAAPVPSPVLAPTPAPSWNNDPSQAHTPTRNSGWNGGERWNGNRGNNNEDLIGRSGGWRGNGSASAPAPSAQAPQAAPAPSDGNTWAGRRDERQGRVTATPNWGSAAPAPPVAQPQPQQRGWDNRSDSGRRFGWNSRNPGYVDPNRNGSYRQTRPDSRQIDAWRNQRDNRGDQRDNWRDGHHEPDRNRWAYNNGNHGWQNNDYWGNNSTYRRWNRNWRQDNRYNWYNYRNNHRDLYRMGRYYAPYRGYSYRRLGIGFQLDSLFFSSNYWIDDPWNYRLPDVDGPYRWVRYYDDALLVDTYTGEVVDVIYNFFW